MAKIKYSDKQVQRLLRGIHNGSITERDLPEDLYEAIRDFLSKGLFEGFTFTLDDVPANQREVLDDLYENISFFSAAKTFNFIKDAGDLLTDADGNVQPFNVFRDEAEQLYGKYNENWLEAEYRTTITSAQAAQQWQSIQESKDVLPFLTYTTAGHPCDECAPFEDFTAEVDDDIWDICMPPLHFCCECVLVQSDNANVSPDSVREELPTDKIPEEFQNNPGKSGEIFTKDHPYFDVPEKDTAYAKRNFDLPVDEPEVEE